VFYANGIEETAEDNVNALRTEANNNCSYPSSHCCNKRRMYKWV